LAVTPIELDVGENMTSRIKIVSLLILLAGGFVGGCAERPTIFPNSDSKLNKKSAAFAADAVNRHPYKSELPKAGQIDGVGAINYTLGTLQLANLSTEKWENLEVWINAEYVVFVPQIEPGKLRTLNFKMFFDGRGNTIPKYVKGEAPRIASLQVLRNNAWYEVPTKLSE
jgi:hypothetical protein